MTAAALPTLMVVPTGVGCSIGGYAGDAIPSARLLASASGCLITHPNVMNGAALFWSDPRIHYVEGYALDRFAVGAWDLRPVRRQRIGLLLDAGIEPELVQRHRSGCSSQGRRPLPRDRPRAVRARGVRLRAPADRRPWRAAPLPPR